MARYMAQYMEPEHIWRCVLLVPGLLPWRFPVHSVLDTLLPFIDFIGCVFFLHCVHSMLNTLLPFIHFIGCMIFLHCILSILNTPFPSFSILDILFSCLKFFASLQFLPVQPFNANLVVAHEPIFSGVGTLKKNISVAVG